MKRFLAFFISALMLLSAFAVASFANSYNARDYWNIDEVGVINVKKADPANVVKDGQIGENEYERYDLDLDPDTSYLHLFYMEGDTYQNAEDMLGTMEYYFSWDEVHGFNFAIRNKPALIHQTLRPNDSDPPEDPFCWDLSYVFAADTLNGMNGGSEHTVLYYALAKTTDTNEYIEGHYGPTQLGQNGDYDPTPEVDYCITYSDDGYSTIEWSVPFEDLYPGAGAGTDLKITLSALAGNTDDPEDRSTSYGVILGDYGYGVALKSQHNHAAFKLSDETIGYTPWVNPFTDVKEKAFYYDAVEWAVKNNITKGMTDTTFEPGTACNRGQVVTFLWRAAGSPAPSSDKCDFTDVKKGAFYYDAMLWAVENGITKGMTDTSFAPNAICNRGQVVTFLHRAVGSPAPSSTSTNFTDVSEKGFYYNAMLWAVENGVTKGMTDTTFAPTADCNRGQVVTFLYRAFLTTLD